MQNREHLFGEIETGRMITNSNGDIVARNWFDVVNHYGNIVLDECVVMPNHFHGIIMIRGHDGNDADGGGGVGTIHELSLQLSQQRRNMLLSKIMGRFKMVSSKQIIILQNTSGMAVWQRNYWEHVVRNEAELSRIRNYVKNNPIMWEQDKLNDGPGNRVLETQALYGEEPWMS